MLYRDEQMSSWWEAQHTNVIKMHGAVTNPSSIVFSEQQDLDAVLREGRLPVRATDASLRLAASTASGSLSGLVVGLLSKDELAEQGAGAKSTPLFQPQTGPSRSA